MSQMEKLAVKTKSDKGGYLKKCIYTYLQILLIYDKSIKVLYCSVCCSTSCEWCQQDKTALIKSFLVTNAVTSGG